MKIRISNKLIIAAIGGAVLLGIALSPYAGCYGKTWLGFPDTIPLDGYSLSVMTCGTKKPTVIIEGGVNVTKESYYGLQRRLFRHFKVITYDHAGIGESTGNKNRRTLPSYVKELKEFLSSQDLQPPYILIGHSLGGHIVRYFTDLYPNEVAGLVFLDHPHEDWFRHIRSQWSAEEQREYFKFWNPVITSDDQIELKEFVEYDNNNDLIRGVILPAHIPVLMFTGDNARHFRKDTAGKAADMIAWSTMQRSIIENVSNAEQIVDWETGHSPHKDKPDEISQRIISFIDEITETN